MKLKSKKMSKSTFAVILMAIAMIAMLAFGGTYALFTANATKVTSGPVTTATIKLDGDTAASLSITGDKLLPGDTVTLAASVTNNSDEKIYAFLAYKLDDASNGTLALTPSGWTKYDAAEGVYYKEIEAGAEVSVAGTAVYEATSKSEGATTGTGMGANVTVTVRFAAVQFRNVASVADAYAAVTADLSLA